MKILTKIEIKGVIVNNDFKEVYEFYGYECTSPQDVISQLPNDGSPVEIILNSGGGHLSAGQELYSRLKDYKGHVTAKVFSLAASSASIIMLGADKVQIAPTAQIMIHNVSSGAEGDYRVMEKEAELLKNFNKAIAIAYTMKTGKSESEILDLMEKETWLNAKEAVEQGFADEILFEEQKQLVANANLMLSNKAINKARMMMKQNKTVEDNVTKSDFEAFKKDILNIMENQQKEEPKPEPQKVAAKGHGFFL